jgi:hypothetical protein
VVSDSDSDATMEESDIDLFDWLCVSERSLFEWSFIVPTYIGYVLDKISITMF